MSYRLDWGGGGGAGQIEWETTTIITKTSYVPCNGIIVCSSFQASRIH